MYSRIEKLENHNVKTQKNIDFKNEVLKNVKLVHNVRVKIIDEFYQDIFPIKEPKADITEDSQELEKTLKKFLNG